MSVNRWTPAILRVQWFRSRASPSRATLTQSCNRSRIKAVTACDSIPAMSSGRIGGPKWMRTGLGTGSSRDLGQASKVPAIPAGTTGTPARDTRTAMPDLSGASLPSRLRVPLGEERDDSSTTQPAQGFLHS